MTIKKFFIENYPVILPIAYEYFKDLLLLWALQGDSDVLSTIAELKMIGCVTNINQRNADGKTALMLAVKNGNIHMVKLLLSHPMIKINLVAASSSETALSIAARNGQVYLVKLLLDNQADPNICTNYEDSALHFALDNCNLEMAKVLVKNGAAAFYEYFEFISPYESNYLQLLRLLIDAGIDVNDNRRNIPMTPLMTAIMADNVEAVQLIIEAGANLECTYDDRYKLTALAMLSPNSANYIALLKILIEGGADVNYIINRIYIHQYDHEVQKHNNVPCTPLFIAIKEKNLDAVRLLISTGAKINDQCILLAYHMYNEDILNIFSQTGVDVYNVCNRTGSSAIERGKMLIDAGEEIIDFVDELKRYEYREWKEDDDDDDDDSS